jgi:hypothetical protein
MMSDAKYVIDHEERPKSLSWSLVRDYKVMRGLISDSLIRKSGF